MRKRLWLFLASCLLTVSMAFAQQKVTGQVLDASSGEPVIGASIVIKGTGTGAPTDLNGRFTINNVPNNALLMVSYIGMKTKEVAVKSGNMRIFLEPELRNIDEVMVVAYGTATRESFTGSASVVDAKQIENRQVSNVSDALSGAVAGVQTLKSNGQPGTASTVRIRGIGSLRNNGVGVSPLYVVDGIPYDGDLNAINTQDIESMTVLKDAAAAALYGSRGANGVIIITTKKGKRGDATVSVDAKWGSNSRQVPNYNVIKSPAEYMELSYQGLYNGSYYNGNRSADYAHNYANNQLASALGYRIFTVPDGETLIGADGKINPNATLGYSDGEYFYTPDDWADGTYRNGLRQEYNVNVSGGDEKLNYFTSFNYLNDEGVIRNSEFDRLSTRLNVDYKVNNWMKVGGNMSYAYTKSLYPDDQTEERSSANAFYMANMIAPIYPMYVRNADGSFAFDTTNGRRIYDYGDGSANNNTRPFMSLSNPISDLIYNDEFYAIDNFNGKWFVELTPIEGLRINANWGLLIDNTRYNVYGNKKYGQIAAYGGQAYQYSSHTAAFTQQYLANYKRSFGKNNFDLLAAFESNTYRVEDHYVYGYNTYKDGDYTVGNAIDNIYGRGSADEDALISWISRLNYDYDGKYFGSLSFRRDGSSRFEKHNRWGNFWSASAGWEMAKESFIKDNADWINMLKFKISYGEQGNRSIGNYYAYIDQYTVTGANGVFSDGTLAYKGNKDITWETSRAFNVGFDFSFWNKFTGTVEYFSRKTVDMLYNRPVAPSNGYTSIPVNIGSIRNYGFEIDLHYTPFKTNDFTWTIDGNATFLNNRIDKLLPEMNGIFKDGTTIFEEGKSQYRLNLVRYAGVNHSTGEALYWAKDDDGKEYATTNWSEASTTNRTPSRDMLPDVYGGFGTTLEWKGFDFGIQFAYQLGGLIFDSDYQRLMHGFSSYYQGQNWHTDIRNAWSVNNPNSDIPRIDATDQYTNTTSDRFLISSNYLALNNITLGYTLPKTLTTRIGISSIRVYCAADNVALFSARKGLDPRQNYISTNSAALYSTIRSISGGIKLTF